LSLFEFLLALYAIVAGARGVRSAMGVILVPGIIISRHPRVHAVQAALLLIFMAIAVSYVAQPIG